jgi:hypothetical protein|tara:strand:- start:2612 stop:2788 length:177 start_codon:yes stop_codon:yes gene_type:complete
MELDNFKKRADNYVILRSYKEAVENIRAQGREPSAHTLARIAKLKMKIRSHSNGQADK